MPPWLHLLAIVAIASAAVPPLRVLVVGGGPAGLVASIMARHAGAHVVVQEKRLNYTRNVFFDLASAPWGHALDLLRAWGLERDMPELYWLEDRSIATVRCCVLERWLAAHATSLGVIIQPGVSSDVANVTVDWDVLIGADGADSSVRLAHFGPPRMSRVGQSSVILEFRACPVAASNVGPSEVAARVSGVLFVYRRFFGAHCHLQVLLRDGMVDASDNRIPWELVLQAVSHAVESPRFASVAELQSALRHSELLRQRVVQAQNTVRVVNTAAGGRAVVLLTGDAVISALYRLGIGLNNLLHAAPDLRTFLALLSRSPREQWAELARQKQAVDTERQQRVAVFQESVIWMEAYCGHLLFFEPRATTVSEDVEIDFDDNDDGASSDRGYEAASDTLPVARIHGPYVSYTAAAAECAIRLGPMPR